MTTGRRGTPEGAKKTKAQLVAEASKLYAQAEKVNERATKLYAEGKMTWGKRFDIATTAARAHNVLRVAKGQKKRPLVTAPRSSLGLKPLIRRSR